MHLFALIVTALSLMFYNAVGPKLITQTKPKPSRTKDITALQGRCAVIVRPDDKKIKLLKKGNSDADYMNLISDNQYYLGDAIGFLNSTKVKQIEKKSTGILYFRNLSGRYYKVSLDSCAWGIILFNGRAKPISADVTAISSSYQAYMKK